jgi:para-nitrobenzyl esterase
MVWIHGGGFFAGSPASPWYRGTRFARDGVVVVSIGYRLGAEGFLALEGAPANRAVLDWLAALRWVQDNITNFGGDPTNVTIAGQSAGAVAVTTLLAMPQDRVGGLFRRAISASGVARATPPDEAAALAATITEHLGVSATRDAVAARPFVELHTAQMTLRAARAQASLLESGGDGAMGQMPFAPIIDGDLVAGKPLKAIATGAGAAVDLLAGATLQETNFAVRGNVADIDEPTLVLVLAGMGLPAHEYRNFHLNLAPADVVAQAVTDRVFRSRVVSLVEARAAGGVAGDGGAAGSGGSGGRTFAYEFRWPSPLLDGAIGAVHCLDLPFAFDLLDAPEVGDLAGPQPPQALADLVHRSWVGFVTSGDPGWPAHDLDSRQMMVFDVESGVQSDPLAAERQLWAR